MTSNWQISHIGERIRHWARVLDDCDSMSDHDMTILLSEMDIGGNKGPKNLPKRREILRTRAERRLVTLRAEYDKLKARGYTDEQTDE